MNSPLLKVGNLTVLALMMVAGLSSAAPEALVPVPHERLGDPLAVHANAVSLGNPTIHVVVALAGYNKGAAEAFVQSLNNPYSGNYHKYLKPGEFALRFGPSPEHAAVTMSYLQSQGFTNVRLAETGLYVAADAPQATAEAAFHTTISTFARTGSDNFEGDPTSYYAPVTAPMVPASVAKHISAVSGLSNRLILHHSKLKANALAGSLSPIQVSKAYKNDVLHSAGYHGEGMTVAVYSPTGWTKTDPGHFASAYGLGTPTIVETLVDGGPTDSGGDVEASLDACMIVGQAPKATVNMVEGPNSFQGTLDTWAKMASLNPLVISSSWGYEEQQFNGDPTDQAIVDAVFTPIASQGIAVFVASGDNGAFDRSSGTIPTVGYEAAQPSNTAVGGTALTDNRNGTFSEGPWSYSAAGNDGAGGGVSVFKTRPTWQVGPHVINADSTGKRQVPDIAAAASPNTPLVIYYINGLATVGGTSAAAPITAGNFILLCQAYNHRIGPLNPSLYQLSHFLSLSNTISGQHYVYNDILGGSNGIQPTAADAAIYNNLGYDYITGLGTIDFSRMLPDLGWAQNLPGYTVNYSFWTPGSTIAGQNWTRPLAFSIGSALPQTDVARFATTDQISLNIAYQNSGNADAFANVIGVFVDDVLKKSAKVKAMPPGYKTTINGFYKTTLPAGNHTFRVVLNYGGGVPNATSSVLSRSVVVH